MRSEKLVSNSAWARLHTTPVGPQKPGEYSNIKEIITEQEYNDICSTTDGPKLSILSLTEIILPCLLSRLTNYLEEGVASAITIREHANGAQSTMQSIRIVGGITSMPSSSIRQG